MASSRKRPLVNTAPLDEFGPVKEELLNDSDAQGVDLTYVPGFSEMRYERDLQLAEYAQGTRRGQDVRTLPVNVRLTRATTTTGHPEGVKLMQARINGYEPLTKKDVGQEWLKKLPPGARELPDGTLATAAGDAIYMKAPAERVALNQRRKQRAMENATASLAEGSEGLVDAGRSIRGASPTVEVQPVKLG